MSDTENMSKLSVEKFVLKLGNLMEKVSIPPAVKSESDFEYAVLPHIKNFLKKELTGSKKFDGVLYHHGRNKEEKSSGQSLNHYRLLNCLAQMFQIYLLFTKKLGQ